MTDAPRMGLGAVLAKLLDTALGRRAIDHLYAAAHAEKHADRRTHLRIAIRMARKALTWINGNSNR